MEVSTNTVLRCVALLGMLVLSFAVAPAPQDSVVIQDTSTLTCAKKCAISGALDSASPPKYAACFGLCMSACKIGPTSDVACGCTRSCVSSMNKVMTTTTKPSISNLTSYAEGYVDSCYQSCAKNNKLY